MQTLFPPLFGWLLSLLFTLGAYLLAPSQNEPLLWTLAAAQLGAQSLLFFGLGRREERWSLLFTLFTLFVAALIVAGSLWILFSLAERMSLR